MKKTRFVLKSIGFMVFTILLMLFVNAYASSSIQRSIPDGYEQIHLNGQLELGQGSNDIEAYTDQVNVYVIFHRSFGLVNITLYNEFWMSIYSDVVNTSVQQTVVIPITGTSDGVYTLVLENANGYAEGDYVKEP